MTGPQHGPLMQRVAANVRAEAGRQQVSRTKIGEVLGLTRVPTAQRLDGQRPFNLRELETLAGFFGIPVADLLNGGKVTS